MQVLVISYKDANDKKWKYVLALKKVESQEVYVPDPNEA